MAEPGARCATSQGEGASDTVSVSVGSRDCKVCQVIPCTVRFMAGMQPLPSVLDYCGDKSAVFSTRTVPTQPTVSCPLAHNCRLALPRIYHLPKHRLLSSGFIAHARTVFTLDSGCVKPVVEEVKNQLFEGTSKWPMAADSRGLADPHYVLEQAD